MKPPRRADWDHSGGFSVNAAVAIHGNDRAGLERLLRYCARPCWSSDRAQRRRRRGATERLTQAGNGELLIYRFDKPRPDGTWQLILTPLELLNRLAQLIPPPRRHLHRYHGVFAPHAKLRAQVAARAGQSVASTAAPPTPQDLAEVIRRALGLPAQAPLPAPAATPGARSWARLIARIYEVDPLRCRHCGATMRLVAFIVERAVIVGILEHLGEPTRAPRAAPIRDPPPANSRRRAAARFEENPPETAFLAPHSRGHPWPLPACDALFLDPMADYENQRQDLGW